MSHSINGSYLDIATAQGIVIIENKVIMGFHAPGWMRHVFPRLVRDIDRTLWCIQVC